eukprot:gene14033-biopygen18605
MPAPRPRHLPVPPGGRWVWNEEFTFSSLCRTSVATPAAGKSSTPTALSPARSGGTPPPLDRLTVLRVL